MRVRGPSVICLLLGTAPAAAQSAGTFEIDGFGRYTRFDDTLRIQQEAGGGGSLAFFPVTFQTGRAILRPSARAVLKDIATQLVENPEYRVRISGHTDNTGSRAANLHLSWARARTVETFLEANGVPPRQVSSKGFGPDVPIASNNTPAGRAKNRRVELIRAN